MSNSYDEADVENSYIAQAFQKAVSEKHEKECKICEIVNNLKAKLEAKNREVELLKSYLEGMCLGENR